MKTIGYTQNNEGVLVELTREEFAALGEISESAYGRGFSDGWNRIPDSRNLVEDLRAFAEVRARLVYFLVSTQRLHDQFLGREKIEPESEKPEALSKDNSE